MCVVGILDLLALLVLLLQLGLEASGHLWGWWSWKAKDDLDRVVNEPLQGGERADHDDTGNEALPETSEADFSVGTANGETLLVVQLAHERVSRMGYDGAEDTSNVASGEGHRQLSALGALFTGGWHHVLVDGLDGALEAGKLHHGVRDLTAPERWQTLVETAQTLALVDDGHALSQSACKAWLCLNAMHFFCCFSS